MAKIRREDLILINREVTQNGVTSPQTYKVQVSELPGSASTDGPQDPAGPNPPVGGDMYYDESTNILYVFNETNSEYQAIGSGVGDAAPSEGARPGTDPVEGQLFFDKNDKELLVYNGTDFMPVGYTKLAQLEDTNIDDTLATEKDNTQVLVYNESTNEFSNENLKVAAETQLGVVKVAESYVPDPTNPADTNPTQIKISNDGVLYFESPFNAAFNFLESRDLRLNVGDLGGPSVIATEVGSIYVHVPNDGILVPSVIATDYEPHIGGQNVVEGDFIILGNSGWYFGGSISETDFFEDFVEITGDEMTGNLTMTNDGGVSRIIEIRKEGEIVINTLGTGDEAVKLKVGSFTVGGLEVLNDLLSVPEIQVEALTVSTKAVVPSANAGDEAVNRDYGDQRYVRKEVSDTMEDGAALNARGDFGDGSTASDEEFVPKKYVDAADEALDQKIIDINNTIAILNLGDLADVDVPNPGSNEALVWDDTAKKWVATNIDTVLEGGLTFMGEVDLLAPMVSTAGDNQVVDPKVAGHMYRHSGSTGNVAGSSGLGTGWGPDIEGELVDNGKLVAWSAQGTWVFLGPALDEAYVAIVGDTMTGGLNIQSGGNIDLDNGYILAGNGIGVGSTQGTAKAAIDNSGRARFDSSLEVGKNVSGAPVYSSFHNKTNFYDKVGVGEGGFANVTLQDTTAFEVEGDSYLNGDVTITGSEVVDNNLEAKQNVTLGTDCQNTTTNKGKLSQECEATFDTNVTIKGDLSIDGDIHGDINFENITIGGEITGDTINIGGGATIEGGLDIDNITIENTLSVGGSVNVDNITIENGASIDGGLAVDDINIHNNLTVGGSIDVDNITVDNGATIDGGLNVDEIVVNQGGATIVGGLEIDDINISNDLTVGGSINTEEIVVNNGGTVVGGLNTDELNVTNGATIEGGLDVDKINAPVTLGSGCDEDAVVIDGPLDVKCDAVIDGDLDVGGSIKIDGTDGGVEINGEGITVGGVEFVEQLGDLTNVTDTTPTAALGGDIIIAQDSATGEWETREASMATDSSLGNVKVPGLNATITTASGATVSAAIGINALGEIYSVLPSSITFKGPVDVRSGPSAGGQASSPLDSSNGGQYTLSNPLEDIAIGNIFINVGPDSSLVESGWGLPVGISADNNQLIGWNGTDWVLLGTLEGLELSNYVRVTGEQMTGDLRLDGAPGAVSPNIILEASSGDATFEGQVTVAKATNVEHALNQERADELYVNILQDTMEGPLYVDALWDDDHGDAKIARFDNELAPKKYVDGLEAEIDEEIVRIDSILGEHTDDINDIVTSIEGGLGAQNLNELEDVTASSDTPFQILKTNPNGGADEQFIVGNLFLADGTVIGGVKVNDEYDLKVENTSGTVTGTIKAESNIGIDDNGVIFGLDTRSLNFKGYTNATVYSPVDSGVNLNFLNDADSMLEWIAMSHTGDIYINTKDDPFAQQQGVDDANGDSILWLSDRKQLDKVTGHKVREGDILMYVANKLQPLEAGHFEVIGTVQNPDGTGGSLNKDGDTMTGNLVIDGADLIVNGSATLGGDCDTDTIEINGKLEVNCPAEFNNNVTVGGDLQVDGSITGTGGTPIEIDGGINIDNITVGGNAEIGGNVTLGGDCNDTISIMGSAYFDCDVEFDKNVGINGDLNVDGNTTINGSLSGPGGNPISIEGGINIDTIDSPLTIGGGCSDDSVIINAPLEVECDVTMKGNVDIGGDLNVDGKTTLGGGTVVDGDLEVTGSINGGINIDIIQGDTISGGIINGDTIVGGDFNGDSIVIGPGGATIEGGLNVDTINGGALIDGPVTIGGECGGDDITVMRGATRFDCDILLTPADERQNKDGALLLKSTSDQSSTGNEQVFQAKDGTIALLEDVSLSEALYLGGALDITTTGVGPTGVLGNIGWTVRPGVNPPALVRGDVLLSEKTGPINDSWKGSNGADGLSYIININDYDTVRGVKRGDRLVYLPTAGQDHWLFLEVATQVNLDTQRYIDKNIITNTAGDDALLEPAELVYSLDLNGDKVINAGSRAGLMTPEDLLAIETATEGLEQLTQEVGDIAFNDLVDVDIDYTNLPSGSGIVWDGTEWVEGPVIAETLGELKNVANTVDTAIIPASEMLYWQLSPIGRSADGLRVEWAQRRIPHGVRQYIGGAKFSEFGETSLLQQNPNTGEERVPVLLDEEKTAYVDKNAINEGMQIQGKVNVSVAYNLQETSGLGGGILSNAIRVNGYTYIQFSDRNPQLEYEMADQSWGAIAGHYVKQGALIQWTVDEKQPSFGGWKVVGYLEGSEGTFKGYLDRQGGELFGKTVVDPDAGALLGDLHFTPSREGLVALGLTTIGGNCTTDTLDVNAVSTFHCDTLLLGPNNTIEGNWSTNDNLTIKGGMHHDGVTIGGNTHHENHTLTGGINLDKLTMGGSTIHDNLTIGGNTHHENHTLTGGINLDEVNLLGSINGNIHLDKVTLGGSTIHDQVTIGGNTHHENHTISGTIDTDKLTIGSGNDTITFNDTIKIEGDIIMCGSLTPCDPSNPGDILTGELSVLGNAGIDGNVSIGGSACGDTTFDVFSDTKLECKLELQTYTTDGSTAAQANTYTQILASATDYFGVGNGQPIGDVNHVQKLQAKSGTFAYIDDVLLSSALVLVDAVNAGNVDENGVASWNGVPTKTRPGASKDASGNPVSLAGDVFINTAGSHAARTEINTALFGLIRNTDDLYTTGFTNAGVTRGDKFIFLPQSYGQINNQDDPTQPILTDPYWVYIPADAVTNLGYEQTATNNTVTNTSGTNAILLPATPGTSGSGLAGLLIPGDKDKLDSLPQNGFVGGAGITLSSADAVVISATLGTGLGFSDATGNAAIQSTTGFTRSGTKLVLQNTSNTGNTTVDILGGTGITSSGSGSSNSNVVTLTLDNTAVGAGTYNSADHVRSFTVDQQGRLTAAGNVKINITSSQVNNFNTSVDARIGNGTFSVAGSGGIQGSGSMTANQSTTTSAALSLTNTGVGANAYGSATHVGKFTVDVKGRLSAASAVKIQIATDQVTGLTNLIADAGKAGGGIVKNTLGLNVDTTGQGGIGFGPVSTKGIPSATNANDQLRIRMSDLPVR